MDRHTFSEPRPVENASIPTWHVDVFRQGVPDPVLTLVINDSTLPARRRKKKVVWKLPDTIEETPNFGSDEKKRMLELFKQQKKTRKKQIKKTTSVVSEATNSSSIQEKEEQGEDDDDDDQHEEEEEEQQQEQQEETNGGRQSPEFYLVTELEGETSSSSINGEEPHLQEAPTDANGLSTVSLPPVESSLAPPTPPPGFAQMSLHELRQQEEPTNNNKTMDSPSFQNHHARYFVVSSLSTNIPVDLAKIVVDIYYPTLSHAAASQLVHYYCPNTQKSLSVGGAHAVCTSEIDVLLQLTSLEQSQFLVKGVVAQPGIQSSVVLLITGMVQSSNVAAPLPFCHSLTLVSCGNGQYQIHNDAMALLTESYVHETARNALAT
jgi:Uri superfamily endonuclease